MKITDAPANIGILELSDKRLEFTKPVTSLDIYEGLTNNFHPNGLFSTEIFGIVGTEERDLKFSYIDIKINILHPFIYKNLIKLKGLYSTIISSKGYAVWDSKLKDFVSSDALHGNTGYNFFMTHFEDIIFSKSESDVRDLRIQFINKFKSKALTSKILVMPAGLRDLFEDQGTGNKKESEINDLYRKILSISNTVRSGESSKITDITRYSLQLAFNNLFEFIKDMMDGKRGFLLAKWAKRNIFNSTRNVITSMDNSRVFLGDKKGPSPNHSTVGMYQFAISALPIIKHQLLTGWISTRFSTAENFAFLTNIKTFKEERVIVKPIEFDRWTRPDGLDKIIHTLSEAHFRMRPIIIQENYYLGLIFLGEIDDKLTFKIFSDIDKIPDNLKNTKHTIVPLTLIDLIYTCGYNRWNTLPCFITRYPIIGEGSIFPTYPYVKTTTVGETRWELDDNWNIIGGSSIAYEFPKHDGHVSYVESLSPNNNRMAGLDGDYDGDMCTMTTVYAKESVHEVGEYLKSKKAYITPDGFLKASPFTKNVNFVLFNLTGEPK